MSPNLGPRGGRGVLAGVWALAGDRRRPLMLSVVLKALQATAQAAAVGVLVIVIAELLDDTLSRSDVGWVAAALACCVCLQWVFGYFANRLAWTTTFEIFAEVRLRLVDHLRRLPLATTARRGTGDALTTVTQDVAAVELFVTDPMHQMIGAGVAPVAVAVLLATQDLSMAAATLASVAAAVPLFVVVNRRFPALARLRQQAQASANVRIIEYIDALPVIRAHQLAGERLTVFRDALDGYRSVNTKLALRMIPLAISAIVVVQLGIASMLFFGGLWLFDGRIDAVTFITFAVLSLRVYQPLIAAAHNVEELRIAGASLERIHDLLAEPVRNEPSVNVANPERFDVTLDDVTFTYQGGPTAVRNCSLHAPAGSVTALVGPSGSGKTTVLQLIAGLLSPDSGTIRIGGRVLAQLTEHQRFDAVTMVFQDNYLFPGTIADNIALGRAGATTADVERAAHLARVAEFIDDLPDGYRTQVGEAGAALSGGQRQRVAIARALLKDAPIVLLDEPTASIDATNERAVHAAIDELARDRTVIVVAHRLHTIQNADQVIVLDGAQIVATGTHHDLLAGGGRYARLWADLEHAGDWSLRHRATATAPFHQ